MRYYLVVRTPAEGDNTLGSRYYRGEHVHDLSGLFPFEFQWLTESGAAVTLTPWPTVQFFLDDQPIGGPILAPPYRFTLDLDALAVTQMVPRTADRWCVTDRQVFPRTGPTLQHVLWARFTGGPVADNFWAATCKFTTGEPQPLTQAGWCWAGPTKWDGIWYVVNGQMPAMIWHPGEPINRRVVVPFRPGPDELRPTAQPYTTIPMYTTEAAKDFFHYTRLGSVSTKAMARRIGVIESKKRPGTPRIVITGKEQYDYFQGVHSNVIPPDPSVLSPLDGVPLVDGPRGSGQLGHGWSGWVARHENPARAGGCVITCTNGRLVFAHRFDGRLATIAGRRLRAEDNFAASPTTQRTTGYFPGPDTWGPVRESQMQTVGDFRPKLIEPWGGVPFGPYPTPAADVHHEEHVISNTLGYCLQKINHRPCHESPNRPPEITLFTQLDHGSEPWDPCRIWNTDETWVPLFMHHAILLIDAKTGVVMDRIQSATADASITLEHPDVRVNGRGMGRSSFSQDALLTRFRRDGGRGTFGFAFPQSVRFDSEGNLIFSCRYLDGLFKWDFASQTGRFLGKLPTFATGFNTRDICIDVNWDGTCGPKDCIRTTQWTQDSARIYSKDMGSWLGSFFPNTSSVDRFLVEGSNRNLTSCHYPTMVASGMGRVYIVGTGTMQGLWVQTRRLPTDPAVNKNLYQTGKGLWQGRAADPYPAFALTHGEDGQGHLGLPNFDDLAELRDGDLAAFLRAGAGSGYPRTLTDAECAAIIYYIRWNTRVVPLTTTPPADTTPPLAPTWELVEGHLEG
jgi:hypothetical protein